MMKFYNREKELNLLIFGEVKRKKENISIPALKDKAKNLQAQLKDYHAEFMVYPYRICNRLLMVFVVAFGMK